uniref:Photosystem II reaction center Psb28 protein n=1 Tax=Gloeochaete wittrockiana TaxID=38269 RepID=A0A3G1IW22_9EUKA|nr:photosystem II protein W [Gloeochaete wittrockiana]ASQ40254.1 photosystem II protein W [Gloeochaete wittrockiana]
MAKIQFIKGINEEKIPVIRLSLSDDRESGIATFYFQNPNSMEADSLIKGDISGMYLIDEEGELTTKNVNGKFVNGKPFAIEASLVIPDGLLWARFMRFMERYAKENNLKFTKNK